MQSGSATATVTPSMLRQLARQGRRLQQAAWLGPHCLPATRALAQDASAGSSAPWLNSGIEAARQRRDWRQAAASGGAGGTAAAAAQAALPHLQQLSEEQLAAVTAPLGTIRVVAGPGSGKARPLQRSCALFCARSCRILLQGPTLLACDASWTSPLPADARADGAHSAPGAGPRRAALAGAGHHIHQQGKPGGGGGALHGGRQGARTMAAAKQRSGVSRAPAAPLLRAETTKLLPLPRRRPMRCGSAWRRRWGRRPAGSCLRAPSTGLIGLVGSA